MTSAVLPGPGDVVRVRASSLADFFDDPLRWRSAHIDGIYGKTYGRSHLGTAIHYGTGWFDAQRVEGDSPSVGKAVQKFLEALHDDQYVTWEDIKKSAAEKIGKTLVAKYCDEISPQFEFVTVESRCEPLELDMPNGFIFELTGTIDRVYARDGRYGVADLKSGTGVIGQDGEVKVAPHGPQLAEYELIETQANLLTGQAMTLPALIIALSTSSLDIKVAEVDNPRSLLFGDHEHKGYLRIMSEMMEAQHYYGNPRSMLCTPRYCAIYDNCFYRRGTAE